MQYQQRNHCVPVGCQVCPLSSLGMRWLSVAVGAVSLAVSTDANAYIRELLPVLTPLGAEVTQPATNGHNLIDRLERLFEPTLATQARHTAHSTTTQVFVSLARFLSQCTLQSIALQGLISCTCLLTWVRSCVLVLEFGEHHKRSLLHTVFVKILFRFRLSQLCCL